MRSDEKRKRREPRGEDGETAGARASWRDAPYRTPIDPGAERGVVEKSWGPEHTAWCLVYPNTYSVGMGNLGVHALYSVLNRRPDTLCERAFLQPLAQGAAREARSVESDRPVSDFDVVALSISFEEDYPNVLECLARAGLPLHARDRAATGHWPLVIAGGIAVTLNPEPLAPFLDAVGIGEGEELADELAQLLAQSRREDWSRDETLAALARVSGVYVPSLYTPVYAEPSELGVPKLVDFRPAPGAPPRVTRRYLTDLSRSAAQTSIYADDTEFGEHALVEVSRGCPWGCRFCASSYAYYPYRARGENDAIAAIRAGRNHRSKVGLVGADVSDHPALQRLVTEAKRGGGAYTLSSLRVGALAPATRGGTSRLSRTMEIEGAPDGVAIAPEAGSQRLRDVICKPLTDAQIVEAARRAAAAGARNVKLYFIIGVETETWEDVAAIAHLTTRCRDAYAAEAKQLGRIGEVVPSLSPLVPKPWTPFQWMPMLPPAELRRRIARVRRLLGPVPNVRVSAGSPSGAHRQALLAAGDRRVADLLLLLRDTGGDWKKALQAWALDADHFTVRPRPRDELFPWDFIDHGLSKAGLWAEYQDALASIPSLPGPLWQRVARDRSTRPGHIEPPSAT